MLKAEDRMPHFSDGLVTRDQFGWWRVRGGGGGVGGGGVVADTVAFTESLPPV